MSYGARVRILGAAWNAVKVQGKRHSPLAVSKDSNEWKAREKRKGGLRCFLFYSP